jgi:hypothetical protein
LLRHNPPFCCLQSILWWQFHCPFLCLLQVIVATKAHSLQLCSTKVIFYSQVPPEWLPNARVICMVIPQHSYVIGKQEFMPTDLLKYLWVLVSNIWRRYSDYTGCLHTKLVRKIIWKLFQAGLKSWTLWHNSCVASTGNKAFTPHI